MDLARERTVLRRTELALDRTTFVSVRMTLETERPMLGFRNRKARITSFSLYLLRSFQNMKIGTIQSLACVGLGTILGFVVATRDFSPSVRAEGTEPVKRQVEGGDRCNRSGP